MILLLAFAIYGTCIWLAVANGKDMRLILAFVFAPMAPAILSAVMAGDAATFFIVAPFAYLFSLSGLPIYFAFRRCGWLSLWHILAASFFLGGAIAFVAGFSSVMPEGDIINGQNAIRFSMHASLTAGVFWLIALYGRRGNSSLNRDGDK